MGCFIGGVMGGLAMLGVACWLAYRFVIAVIEGRP